MKKKKLVRNVSLVALSACMVFGTTAALAGCGGGSGDPTKISVYIFCNESDEQTNKTICQTWVKTYAEEHNLDIELDFRVNYVKDDYFTDLKALLNGGLTNVPDIIYLSPKYVQTYADVGYVMDMSEYIVQDSSAVQAINGIWSNAISYYGYEKGNKSYEMGQQIVYMANGSEGAGYYTTDGSSKVGIYGLPKDYSNFSMGYNKKYFSDELRVAYQTTKGSATRDVTSATEVGDKLKTQQNDYTATKYTGYTSRNDYVATYAVSGSVTIAETGETVNFQKGEEAPIISIGVPVYYKPFNFYRYNSFSDALAAGDPMAVATDTFTEGQGYAVTIPGFPGDTFEVPAGTATDSSAPYDSSIGHIVYTYQEYGALVWAVTYYLNTFDWDSASPLSGKGGFTTQNGNQQVIYGSEQYEGAQGNALYLLPWLASNDADLIDTTSSYTSNKSLPNASATALASTLAGTDAETRQKLNLDGTYRNAEVQYGMNSENFIETYAAYQEFGSTWNGNSGNAGDEDTAKTNASGWDYFCMGAAVFYGAGTWDAATRNDTQMDVFEFGQMPSPVAEKYALYSTVKDADYAIKTYSNDPDTAKGSGDAANNDGAQRATLSAGLKVYTADEIVANQLKRQDKWAARMDSVGYAANGRFANLAEDDPEYWKAAGTASLIQALTIGETEQVTLTYAGAQLPNFVEQCSEFLYFQSSEYANGSFKDMITYEGFSTTTDATEGRAIWDYYYEIACAMAKDSLNSANKSVTVAQWIAQTDYTDYGGSGTVRYDEQYADTTLGEFTGGNNTNISFAMKVLRMVAFTYADRDLNIRMQYGLNSVRDSSMYTESDTWLGALNASTTGKMLAYYNQNSLTTEQKQGLGTSESVLARTIGQKNSASFWTPAVYCVSIAQTAQGYLSSNA